VSGLVSPYTSRERILAIGAGGAGKTSAWLSIAEKCPDAHFYALDTELNVDRMLEGRTLPNVTHEMVFDWPEYRVQTHAYVEKAKPGDWLIVDSIGAAWSSVSRHYTETAKGKSLEDFLMEKRIAKGDKKGGDFDSGTDWPTINAQYKAWEMDLLKANRNLHIFMTAPAKAVGPMDGAEVVALAGRHGMKPEGQKGLGHFAHTVLWLKEARQGWEMTTLKDRQRKVLAGEAVSNFAVSYLMLVAGWTAS
jgi:hypothetical protein